MKSTPLTASVILLPAEHMGSLIEHGATIDYADAEEHTALMAAAMVGDEDCLRLLLERGADFLKAYNENHTALQMATHDGNSGCMKLLLARADLMLQRLKVVGVYGWWGSHGTLSDQPNRLRRGQTLTPFFRHVHSQPYRLSRYCNFLHGMMFDGINYRGLIRWPSALGAC